MKNKNSKIVVCLALILFVCVVSTTVAVAEVMEGYLLDDKGAISIIQNPAALPSGGVDSDVPEDEQISEEGFISEEYPSYDANGVASGSGENMEVIWDTYNPGFAVEDEHGVYWRTNTEVEIFKISYENGEGNITVKSDNGEKVVAPGTENSYSFKFKNTGDVPVDYWLTVEAYITPGDKMIPIESRINRYDGKWVAGGADSYVDIPTLDGTTDSANLGVGRYNYYTLDWRWPFEGDDELDTFLGNLAVDEDITVTIVLKTIAMANPEASPGGGITSPDTGDNSILSLWIALAAGCVVLIVILIAYKIREDKRSKTEALKN